MLASSNGKASSSGMSFSQLSKAGLAPTVSNAPYLKHFFNKDSVDRTAGDKLAVIRDLRGDLVYDFANIGASAKLYVGDGLDSNSIQIHSGGVQTKPFSGTPYSAGLTDNVMYVVAGYIDANSESNLIFRLGSINQNDGGGIRLGLDDCADGGATLPTTPSLGVDLSDVGIVTSAVGGNMRLPRSTAEISQDATNGLYYPFILVCMMDRANNQMLYKTWIVNDIPISPIEAYVAQPAGNYTGAAHVSPLDITGMGVISPSVNVPPIQGGAFSMQGYFYGIGVWSFPDNYVPPNWYEAAVSMGHAWIDDRFDFYNF